MARFFHCRTKPAARPPPRVRFPQRDSRGDRPQCLRQDCMSFLAALSCASTRGRQASLLILSAALFLLTAPTVPAQATTSKEYQVKAVSLFNCAQFVDWPATNFA